jgi:putative effector of murein hydrolase LrgA (UPF0299 family)
MLLSVKRVVISAVLSVLLEFYAFNFVPRNVSIIATRSFSRQIFDYVLNFVIFFIVIYLVITLVTHLLKRKNK